MKSKEHGLYNSTIYTGRLTWPLKNKNNHSSISVPVNSVLWIKYGMSGILTYRISLFLHTHLEVLR